MKGIAHFTTGVAAASFFPFAVEAAQAGNPLYFVLGGAFGILPDTLDFKFYRYFYHHDVTITPDPLEQNPQMIADQLAAAVGRGREMERGCRVKLNSIQMGADLWQQYIVKFDPEGGEVLVRFGPIVNTGQVPVPGTLPEHPLVGRAKLPCAIEQHYDATTKVDIFDGPSFLFERGAGDRVEIEFLPWHRSWTHSFPVALAFGMIIWLLWGLWQWIAHASPSGFVQGWRALAVTVLGFAGHLLEDQLGFMGSNLFAPFTRKRSKGLHIMRSGDAFPNFLTVWMCMTLIFWNLYRAMPDPAFEFNFMQLILYSCIIPIGIFGILFKLANLRRHPAEGELDIVSEWSDSMMG
jgi:membrane-bound metal-dependent hydrolase YbcI (DUF457 family)